MRWSWAARRYLLPVLVFFLIAFTLSITVGRFGAPVTLLSPDVAWMDQESGYLFQEEPQLEDAGLKNARFDSIYSFPIVKERTAKDFKLAAWLQRHLDRFTAAELRAGECNQSMTVSDYMLREHKEIMPRDNSWEKFYAQIGLCDLYRRDSAIVNELLHDLDNKRIKLAEIMPGGTQVKLIITFGNGRQAVFKPLRFDLDYETNPNHFYFSDFERSNVEIAAFHLDRALGFRRAIPTIGRRVNLTELMQVAESQLQKTFFYSPAKNLCFVSKCDYYCDTSHAICGNPDLIFGSMQVMLPSEEEVPREHVKSPYRRTYSKKNQQANWQISMSFCDINVKTRTPYSYGRRLLDLVDVYIFDFLMGNLDRHHYETISLFSNDGNAIHMDNGRGFGRSDVDFEDILLPLTQCCVIRPSTLQTLVNFYRGKPETLPDALRKSLALDPMAPVLAEKFMPAIERRLGIVLREVKRCIEKRQLQQVVRNVYSAAGDPAVKGKLHSGATDDDTKSNDDQQRRR